MALIWATLHFSQQKWFITARNSIIAGYAKMTDSDGSETLTMCLTCSSRCERGRFKNPGHPQCCHLINCCVIPREVPKPFEQSLHRSSSKKGTLSTPARPNTRRRNDSSARYLPIISLDKKIFSRRGKPGCFANTFGSVDYNSRVEYGRS